MEVELQVRRALDAPLTRRDYMAPTTLPLLDNVFVVNVNISDHDSEMYSVFLKTGLKRVSR
jgi:hypothetical protein